MRATVPAAVPGAASTLVLAASEPLLVPRPPDTALQPAPTAPGPASAEALSTAEPVAVDTHGDAPTTSGPPVPGAAVPLPGTVALGFADGQVHALPPDDPRLTTFQDAAAAVLGRHGD